MTLATGVNGAHSNGNLMTTSAKPLPKMLMSDLMQTVGILPILILIVAVFGFIAPNFLPKATC